MGKKDLQDFAKNLDKAAGIPDPKLDDKCRKNVKGTSQEKPYSDAIKRYDPFGSADALANCASTLRGIAGKLPTHSMAPLPKSNPIARRLKRQAKD